MRAATALVMGTLLFGCSLNRSGLASEEELADATALDSARADTAALEVEPADTLVLDDTNEADTADTADTMDTMPIDTAPPCTESGSVMSAGHCYFPIAMSLSFDGASSACANAIPPAHLAAITSSAEQTVVGGVGTGDRWIGLKKDSSEPTAKSSFDWVTGEAATYDNWAAGDPNGGHNCARMTAAGTWADYPCGNTFPAICERD